MKPVAGGAATHGHRGAAAIMTKLADSPVHTTIGHAAVRFRIVPVPRHVTRRDGA